MYAEEENSFIRVMIWPIPGVFFYIFTFTKSVTSMLYVTVGLPAALCFYILFFFTIKKDNKKKQENNEAVEGHCESECEEHGCQFIMALLAVITGLCWTYLLIGVLVDMLNTVGVILNIDNTYLGLTILAVGNALPDALVTIEMVKNPRKATMAISGGYAGQLFGLLVGFGLSMLKLTLTRGPQKFLLFNPKMLMTNLLDILVIFTALIVLLVTFFWGICNNFKMTKAFAIIIGAVYLLFFLSSTAFMVYRMGK